MVVDRKVSLGRFVDRAGEELGTWVKADYGLELLCRGEDILGSFWLRAQGQVLGGVQLPMENRSGVPGHVDMEVWTDKDDSYGAVYLCGPEDAYWWEMRA